MRVLVACEFSGTVRDAFRDRGHDAVSCDLLPSETSGPHYQGDVRDILHDGWDLMIAHPPCTYLASSGMHWTTRGFRDSQLTEEALNFVRELLDAPIPRIALENPIGAISTRIRKPDQIIQPWMFGHDASKRTCLWLKGLPPLMPTKIVPPQGWSVVKFVADLFDPETEEAPCPDCGIDFAVCTCIGPSEDVWYKEIEGVLFGRRTQPTDKRVLWGNQTKSGQNRLPPSSDRWKLRSKTYKGIAEAMAEQWSFC